MADGEPTLDPEQTARIAAHGAKAVGAHRLFTALAGVLLLGLLLGGVGVYYLAGSQRAAATAAQRLSQQVRGLGGTPVVEAPAPIAGQAGQPGKDGAPGKQGPGPSQREIDDAVAAFCGTGQCGPTPAMVGVRVAAYLTAHPPKQGPPPTPAMIATAASDYIGAHAAAFQGAAGTNGADGVNGQNATDDQVTAAVGAYCDAHSQCQGPQGHQGDQGVSVTDLQFQRDTSGACQAVITLHDPATGQDSTVSHPAGDAACPVVTPPTTTPSATNGLIHLGGN